MRQQHSIVVTGTLALDLIGRYPGRFDTQLHGDSFGLSVRLDHYETRFGGCAVNIAWNLKLLGAEPILLVRAGVDFEAGYAAHLRAAGIDLRGVYVDPQVPHSSRCVLLGDAAGQQITAWYSGPASDNWNGSEARAADLAHTTSARLAIVAPDHPLTMLRHLRELRASGVDVLTDPGQGIGDFTAAQVEDLVSASTEIIVNANEHAALLGLLGATPAALRLRLACLVVTHGPGGAEIFRAGRREHVPAVAVATVVDSTGAGDAFRAGWACGRLAGLDDTAAARCGAVIAAFAVESAGPQAHRPTPRQLAERHQHAYGLPWPLAAAF